MRPEQLNALRELRHLSESSVGAGGGGGGDGGWLAAIGISAGILVGLFALVSSIALPLYLVRLHFRLKAIERRLDSLTSRAKPRDWFSDDC